MTWPQLAIWAVVKWEGENAFRRNVVRTWTFDEGVDHERAVGAFRALVDHFETLRTVFAAEGPPRQRLLESGAVPVTLHRTTSAGLDGCAAALADRLRGPSFDLAADVPVRLGMSMAGGRVFRVVVAVSHVAVDEMSVQILEEAYRSLVARGEDALRDFHGVSEQPLDRARFEHSRAGERARTRTLGYWRKAFSEVPVAMLTGGSEAGARAERARLRSYEAARAISELTRRTGANSTAILLGAYAVAVAGSLDVAEVAVRTLVATRKRSVARRSVAALNLNGLFRLSLAPGTTVGDYFRSAQDAAHKAVVYSETDPAELDRELDVIAARRGVRAQQYLYFNDMSRGQFRWQDDTDTGTGDGRPAGPPDEATVVRTVDDSTPDRESKLLLDVYGVEPALNICLYIDRRSVPVSAVSFLRAVERFVVESSRRPSSPLAEAARSAARELDTV
ncbi:condensation domain-containing protein [Streptomyces sp. NPDC004031]